MIRTKHIKEDLRKVYDVMTESVYDVEKKKRVEQKVDEKTLLKALIKVNTLILKVLVDVKQNQVKVMEHQGIELVRSEEEKAVKIDEVTKPK